VALRFYFYLSYALGIKEGIKESRGELKKCLKFSPELLLLEM